MSDRSSSASPLATVVSTNADRIVRGLQTAGVQRLFGMPGGGSNADVIEAARRIGLPFSLSHTETGSAFMATAQAEITGRPGTCITTLGPGAASVMNGVANAYLDRVPLIVLTDCHPEDARHVMEHQNLRQDEMFKPIVKWSARLAPADLVQTLERAIATAMAEPRGPVHLDVSSDVAGGAAPLDWVGAGAEPVSPEHAAASDGGERRAADFSAVARGLLTRARRPVLLLGLGSRSQPVAAAVRAVCEARRIPALVTYKAKGVVPDAHRWYGGVLTNGALERDVIERADLLIAIGLDPVELLPRPWAFPQPVIAVNASPIRQRQILVAEEAIGDVASIVDRLGALMDRGSDWTESELRTLVQRQRDAMRPAVGGHALLPHQVVEVVAEYYEGARATVDAGAHMFPVMALWPAHEPLGMLISNGLSTMGFAVPAAIGAALVDRAKPTIAFTGDGGLLMCLGELCTAAREAVPVRTVVFNDGALNLIKVKQLQRGYAHESTSFDPIKWDAIGDAFGIVTRQASTVDQLRACLADTYAHPGPVLIAATVAGEAYPATIRALRG